MFGRNTIGACFIVLLHPVDALAQPLPGPIPAELVSVIDGDTVAVRARIWPGQFVDTRVRVAGIDTPEIRGAGCEAERIYAATARQFTEGWLQASEAENGLFLHQVEIGSFAGRVIADIGRADGSRLSVALLEEGLAVQFGEEGPWCAGAPPPAQR